MIKLPGQCCCWIQRIKNPGFSLVSLPGTQRVLEWALPGEGQRKGKEKGDIAHDPGTPVTQAQAGLSHNTDITALISQH